MTNPIDYHEKEPEMRKFTGRALLVGTILVLAVVILAWVAMRDTSPEGRPAVKETPPGQNMAYP